MSLAADNDGGYQDSVKVPLAAARDLQLLLMPGRSTVICARAAQLDLKLRKMESSGGSAVVWLLLGVLVMMGRCKMGKANGHRRA